MPYIEPERRIRYDADLKQLARSIDAETPAGDINYVITGVLVDWLRKRGVNYASLADVIKVLETAKLEFYRRVAAPYEDGKVAENGDVYEGL